MYLYLLNKYIKCGIWRLAERSSYIWDARCLKVKSTAAHGEVESLLFRIRFNAFPFEISSLSSECGSETDYYVYIFPNVQLTKHV
jgi:hypothetical protein